MDIELDERIDELEHKLALAMELYNLARKRADLLAKDSDKWFYEFVSENKKRADLEAQLFELGITPVTMRESAKEEK